MTELPTVSLEPPRTPRRRSRETWALLSLTAAGGVLLAAIAPRFPGYWHEWAVFGVTTLFSAALAIIDERTVRLPNHLTAALAVFGITQAVGTSLAAHSFAPLGAAAMSATVLTAAYAVLAFTGSCGFGDAKFAGALALAIAPFIGALALYLLPISFMVSAVRIMVRRMQGRHDRHPHGTSLAIASVGLMATGLLASSGVIPV